MSRLSWLQKIYWTRFSKPIEQRALVRILIEQPISSVLEVGLGNGSRMQRIAKLVNLSAGCQQLRYIGVDEFEASPPGRVHLSLKQAHQMATHLGFKASLIPGNSAQAMSRVAHKFGASDLIIINGGLDLNAPSSGSIGGWLNRIAHSTSTILACQEADQALIHVNRQLLDLPLVKAA